MKTNIIIAISALILTFPGCDPGASGGSASPDKPIHAQDICADFNGGSGSLCDDFNGENVNSEVWQVAGWVEHGGQTSPERCYAKNGILNMVFINSSEQGFLSSAIQTWSEYGFGRWEARIKPSSVPGVLNSLYTIDWYDVPGDSDGTKQEIDIRVQSNSLGQTHRPGDICVHQAGRPYTTPIPTSISGSIPQTNLTCSALRSRRHRYNGSSTTRFCTPTPTAAIPSASTTPTSLS